MSSRHPRVLGPATAVIVGLSIGVLGFLADLLTKTVVLARLDPAAPIELIPSVLYLHLVRNPGAAFSMGENLTVGLTCLAIAAVVFLAAWMLPRVRDVVWTIATGLLLAGVSGNLFDRLTREPGVFRGRVVDYIQVPFFAIFNVADIWITCAAILIIWQSVVRRVSFTGQPAVEPAPKAHG